MKKTLTILIALAVALLAAAVALLIYLESGKGEVTEPTDVPSEPTSSVAEETDAPEETTVPVETDFVPETQEGGMPVYPFEPDTDVEEPTQGDPNATEETYVPDEDELPQMPL